MLEIPQRLVDLIHRLLYDFEYFEYAFLNGGWVGVLGISFIILMIRKQGKTNA